MSSNKPSSRRSFVKKFGSATLALAAAPLAGLAGEQQVEERIIAYNRRVSANDKIRIAVIGLGIALRSTTRSTDQSGQPPAGAKSG